MDEGPPDCIRPSESVDVDFDDWLASAFGSDSAEGGRHRVAVDGPASSRRGGAGAASEQGDVSAGGSTVHAGDTEDGTAGSMGEQSAWGSAVDEGGGRQGSRRARGGRRRGGPGSGGSAGPPPNESAQQRAHRLFYERKKERVSASSRGKGVHWQRAARISCSFPGVTRYVVLHRAQPPLHHGPLSTALTLPFHKN